MHAVLGGGEPLIIITDAAEWGDDCVAIAMLLGNPRFDVKLIVCTSGNVWSDDAAQTVRRLLFRLGHSSIPVCVGQSPAQLSGRVERYISQSVRTKILYAGALATPAPLSHALRCDGISKLVDTLRTTEAVVLIIGPATPLAAAFTAEPDIVHRIKRIVMMGGALNVPGNATKYAEFNFWFDAEAADTIFRRHSNVTLLPLDATDPLAYPEGTTAVVDPKRRKMGYLIEYLATRRLRAKRPFAMWDEASSAILLNGELIESCAKLTLRVVMNDDTRYGKLYSTNQRHIPTVRVVSKLASKRLVEFVLRTLNSD